MNNYIIYDWVSFTSRIHSPHSVIDMLGLGDINFETLHGMYGYRERLYYNGISIHFNGNESKNMGVLCEMSGKGCRTFVKFGYGNYHSLFDTILFNYSDDSAKRQMNLTRLDVAYDDFIGTIDLDLLCHETQKLHFVSRFKDWQVITGNKGIAVNHGSLKSNVYIRCYDKRLEQEVQDQVEHWVRLEIQMRKECALGFILNDGTIQEKYFQTLNQYLRYIIPSSNTTNSSMLQTAPYWLRFLEDVSSRSIFHKPADNYDFNNLYSYVTNQLSGAIQTYIDCVGVEQFVNDIKEARKGKKLNNKYKYLLDQKENNRL